MHNDPYAVPFDEVAQLLSRNQMGDIASDHSAELNGWSGWNQIAITAAAKQAARSIVCVYDDSARPEIKEARKAARLEHGWNWKKAFTRESHGEMLPPDHKLVKLLQRPNPDQSGGSFRWEQILQLRLHGSCIVLNHPNAMGRTVHRYIVPIALATPVPPGYRDHMPRGGIQIRPTSYWAGNAPTHMADGFCSIASICQCVHSGRVAFGGSVSASVLAW